MLIDAPSARGCPNVNSTAGIPFRLQDAHLVNLYGKAPNIANFQPGFNLRVEGDVPVETYVIISLADAHLRIFNGVSYPRSSQGKRRPIPGYPVSH